MYCFLGIDTHQFNLILSFDKNPIMYLLVENEL